MTLDALLLHPHTRADLQSFLVSPSHGLMLTGQAGAGKETVARTLLSALLGEHMREGVLVIEPSKTHSIGIEDIKSIKNFVKLKTTGHGTYRRAILVLNAHSMTAEAQNALLKTLEEPPADTLLVLTTSRPKFLLPTIASRVRQIHILPISHKSIKQHYAHIPESAEKNHILGISGGAVGLADALFTHAQEHPLAQAIIEAKTLLSQGPFERLARIDQFTKDKDQLALVIEALAILGNATLQQVAKQGKNASLRAWHRRLHSIQGARDYLEHNVSPKLILTDLFLSL